MNNNQRAILAKSLAELDYPIISKHAIKADNYLANTYLRLAWHMAIKRKRYDLLSNIYQLIGKSL